MTTTAADTDGTIAQVEFFHGTTLIGTATAAPYRVLWNGVPAGSYSLTASATDNQGAVTRSDPRVLTVNATNTPPTVSLTAPADGAAYVLPVTVTLSATASGIEDNTPITRVDFHHGSTLIGGSTTAPYTTTWAPPTAGTYHLTAIATDSAGGVTTSAARTITVQGSNQLPNVSLTNPLANQSFAAPANIALAAIASDADGTIARVEFFQGSTLIGSATAAPYGAAWNNVPAGSYILTARATDDRGATRSTTAIPITVTGGGPSILYLHGDHLGTPRVATNEANVVVWRNPPTTEPFGMALPEEDPDGDGRPTVINLRFPGQYFDRETLLHYNYFRDHYFPDLGRYGQSDPIGLAGGINTYLYVGARSIGDSDPLGLFTEVIQWATDGSGSGAWGHISGNINGRNYSWGPNGWDKNQSATDYMDRQLNIIKRNARGVLLDLSFPEEQFLATCLRDEGVSYGGVTNNCGNPWLTCLGKMGVARAGNRARVLPVDVFNIIRSSPRAVGETDYSRPGKKDFSVPPIVPLGTSVLRSLFGE